MYGKYTLFYKSPKTGDITHMRSVYQALSSGGWGGGEGPGDEASDKHAMVSVLSSKYQFRAQTYKM